tara:strand:+ start:2554 stop:2925 length:372 start_codon:yes stop_codon:yes gene_type:complete
MKQYEITNYLMRFGSKMKLDKNELHVLMYMSSLLNLTKYPNGTIKVTKPQIQEGMLLGRDAVNKGVNGLKEKGYIKYICTWQYLIEVNIKKIIPCEDHKVTTHKVRQPESQEEFPTGEYDPPF